MHTKIGKCLIVGFNHFFCITRIVLFVSYSFAISSAVDGKIDFLEFVKVMRTRMIEQAEAQRHLKESFKVFVRDNSGFLNVAQMKLVLTQRGDKMTDEEVEEMLSFADPDGSGRINYEGKREKLGRGSHIAAH